MKKVLFVLLACTTLLTACKKNKNKNTAEKVVGKWSLVSIRDNSFYSNTPHVTTLTGTAFDYIEFLDGGIGTVNIGGSADLVTYSVVGDTKLVLDGETFDILGISDNVLLLYSKTGSATVYDESTISLKK